MLFQDSELFSARLCKVIENALVC